MPAEQIADANYYMTLSRLGLIQPPPPPDGDPLDILESIAAKEETVSSLIREMRELLTRGSANGSD